MTAESEQAVVEFGRRYRVRVEVDGCYVSFEGTPHAAVFAGRGFDGLVFDDVFEVELWPSHDAHLVEFEEVSA